MKTLYEVTRPIIETIALDGRIDVAIQYAYDLYRPEILNKFDKGVILAAWRAHLMRAAVESQAWDTLLRRMVLGRGMAEKAAPGFGDRLGKSSLAYLVNTQPQADYSELLFNEFIVHKLLAGESDNETARLYVTWLGWAVELVLHLDDTTNTFTDQDVDAFTYWVKEVLDFLTVEDNKTTIG